MVTIAAGMTLGAYTILHDNAHLPTFAPPIQPIQPQYTVTVPPRSNYGPSQPTTPAWPTQKSCTESFYGCDGPEPNPRPTQKPDEFPPDVMCKAFKYNMPGCATVVPTVPNIPGQPQYQVVSSVS